VTAYSAIYGHLGAVLRDAKGDRTVRDVADRAGVSPSTVSAWFGGYRRMAIEDLLRYGDVVDVKAEELLAEARRRMVAE
jgi:transcriptional regulator with XRE-family HTH domain